MTITLRDGTTVGDPRLDRLIQFDDRSRGYPVRALIEAKRPRSYSWRCTTWLDQGVEGSCVGHAVAHELAARPSEVQGVDHAMAVSIYRAAQKIDPWPGEAYEGTSVLAGVKTVQSLGWCEAYRWAFGLQDLILGVGYNGPAVIGVNWYSGMMRPDDGWIRVGGSVVGGHAILVRGVHVAGYFTLRNSWGRDWGRDGDCCISFADMDRLLHEDGEAVFLQGRHSTPIHSAQP